MQKIDDYKKIFVDLGRENYFELNKPFIMDIMETKNKIDELSKDPLTICNPFNPAIKKPTESAKILIRLKALYTTQVIALNKILGNNIDAAEKDPLAEWKTDKEKEENDE